MSNYLIIVESPTKSKTIEKFLGKNYTVKASMGHLRDLPKSTMGVDIENDFEPKYVNIRGKGDMIKELKKLAKEADKVYLATDPDREGEAISWHLAYLLGLDANDLCRIEFNEITKTRVSEAVKHPRKIDMPMVEAQQARRILDRVVGYELSPLLWRKIRKGLSAGRVQSVAVKIVADRDREIADFVPEEYWTIKAKLREEPKSPIFTADVTKYKNKKLVLHNEAEAKKAYDDLANASYVVTKSERKDKKQHAYPPFTTSTLQQAANRRLGFAAKKTMNIAQQLYEGVSIGRSTTGLITYMRTDSVRLANEAVASIRDFVAEKFGSEYLPAKPNFYNTSKSAQDAHEAIRPTDVTRTPESIAQYLRPDQLRLYTLIWNRTVQCQMADAIYDSTVLTIGANGYELRASGQVLKFPGYLALTKNLNTSEDDAEGEEELKNKVPYVEVGKELVLHKLQEAEQHFTEPPAHYTEATLVKELETKGIGRPSTFASTIQTIMDRGYVEKEQKKLLITDLGIITNDFLTDNFPNLIDIPFSAFMEGKLDEIAESKEERVPLLHSFYEPFHKAVTTALEKYPKVDIPLEVSDVPCEKCGAMMVYRESKFGRFLACPNFPACRNTKNILNKIGVVCPKCGGDLIEKKTRTGKTFYACDHYPECDFNSWDKPLNENCELCGSLLVEHYDLRRRKHKYCLNPDCKNCRPLPRVKSEQSDSSAKKPAKARGSRKTTSTKRKTRL
ncbi:MAG: type I DNA topoisomerase [Phascolarctobacterium sp.]|nr:type I DNA topoisomerase [Phascolarctobacterium sp.]